MIHVDGADVVAKPRRVERVAETRVVISDDRCVVSADALMVRMGSGDGPLGRLCGRRV